MQAQQIVLSLALVVRILRAACFGTVSLLSLKELVILLLAGFASDGIFWLGAGDYIFVWAIVLLAGVVPGERLAVEIVRSKRTSRCGGPPEVFGRMGQHSVRVRRF